MNIEIGKRYCWSPTVGDHNKYMDGLCEKIEGNFAYLITKSNQVWKVNIQELTCYKEKKS